MTPHRRLPRSFWHLTAARTLSTFASNMLAVIVGWSIFHQSHSALALGLAGLAEGLPAIGLSLWAGWLVDRGDALRIFRRAIAGQSAVALLPLLALLSVAYLPPALYLATLYGVSMLAGVVRAFFQPCLYTLTPLIVPREQLPQAAAYTASYVQAARVLGPGVGGLLYGMGGAHAAFGTALLCLLASRWQVQQVQMPTASRPEAPLASADTAKRTIDWPGMLMGLRFVFSHPILLPALSLDMICVLFAGVTAVLPAFAEDVLHAGPSWLGFLRAAPAFGAVVGSLLLTRIGIRASAGRALLWAVAGFGVATMAFAFSRSVIVSFALLWLSGLLDSVSVLVRQLIVQLLSPPHLRGRISAVNAMFIGSSNEIGEFESGVAAWAFGLQRSVLGGCTMCLAMVALMAARSPQLRALDLRHAHTQTPPAPPA